MLSFSNRFHSRPWDVGMERIVKPRIKGCLAVVSLTCVSLMPTRHYPQFLKHPDNVSTRRCTRSPWKRYFEVTYRFQFSKAMPSWFRALRYCEPVFFFNKVTDMAKRHLCTEKLQIQCPLYQTDRKWRTIFKIMRDHYKNRTRLPSSRSGPFNSPYRWTRSLLSWFLNM
jgi:hypothetical protein